jgi:hypothetical protein
MLSTLVIGTAAAKQVRRARNADPSPVVGVIALLLILAIAVIKYVGTCTIFARANPKLPRLPTALVFVLFLLFGDLYLLYFSLRWGINGLRGLAGQKVVDYVTLPYPRGT